MQLIAIKFHTFCQISIIIIQKNCIKHKKTVNPIRNICNNYLPSLIFIYKTFLCNVAHTVLLYSSHCHAHIAVYHMPQTRFSHYFTIAVAECFCFYCTFTYSIAYTLHTYVSLSALFLFYCTAIIIAIN